MQLDKISTFKSARILGNGALTWVHFETFGREEADFLRSEERFHPLDIKDCLGVSQRPKIDVYNNYLFLVLHFPDYNSESKRLSAVEINFFLTKDALFTIQKQKFKAIRQFFYRTKSIDRIKKEVFSGSSGILLYHILDDLFYQALPVMDRLTKFTKEIENEIYSEGETGDAIRNLALLRRNILEFKRIVDPERFVINTLVHLRRPYFPEELSVYYDDIHDNIEELWSYVTNTKEIVDGLHAVNESLVTHRTNEVLKILATLSAILMPPTLIASAYGMNISLPIQRSPLAFCLIVLLMAGIVGGLLYIFRRKKWL